MQFSIPCARLRDFREAVPPLRFLRVLCSSRYHVCACAALERLCCRAGPGPHLNPLIALSESSTTTAAPLSLRSTSAFSAARVTFSAALSAHKQSGLRLGDTNGR